MEKFIRKRVGWIVPMLACCLWWLVPCTAEAQRAKDLKYIDARELAVIGKGFEKSGAFYSRLPEEVRGKIRKELWDLGQNTAGLAVRFRSDSKCIGARWTLLNNFQMAHMAGTGIRGLDLYVLDSEGEWRFAGTAQPNGKESSNIFIRRMDGTEKEFLLFLPLYDGVESLEIGIDSTAFAGRPEVPVLLSYKDPVFGTEAGAGSLASSGKNSSFAGGTSRPGRRKNGALRKPIVFYGTSITQGGCSSRPGMAYPAIVSRKLQTETINLGFSGNGRMDRIVADRMAELEASAFVIDCLPNCTRQMVRDSAEYFIRTVAGAHPEVPVYLVNNPYFPYIDLDAGDKRDLEEENALWYGIFRKLRKEGYRNLRYIDVFGGRKGPAAGKDGEATVDGIHLTDLGAMRLAEVLVSELRRGL